MRVSEVNPGVDADYRKMHRVFQMVSELHKVGYQGIRIYTQFYMSRRIWIAPAILIGNGDLSGDISESYRPGTEYTDGPGPGTPLPTSLYFRGLGKGFIALTNDGQTSDSEYFGWDDASGCTAKQLANKFLERFPQLTEVGLLDDLAYAGWLSRLIGEMEHGWYPVWINSLGFIRLKPTSDRTRTLEQRLTCGAIERSEINALTDIGYSEPIEPKYDTDGLLGPGIQMRYLCSNDEGDGGQQAPGVFFTFPLPPPLDIDQKMLTSLLMRIFR